MFTRSIVFHIKWSMVCRCRWFGYTIYVYIKKNLFFGSFVDEFFRKSVCLELLVGQ